MGRADPGVGGWLHAPPEKTIKSGHSVQAPYIGNVISFSYKPKLEILIFRTSLAKFSKNFNSGLHFTENRLFWARWWLWRHCDVILGMLVLGMYGKKRSLLYYAGYQEHESGFSFSPLYVTRLLFLIKKIRVGKWFFHGTPFMHNGFSWAR